MGRSKRLFRIRRKACSRPAFSGQIIGYMNIADRYVAVVDNADCIVDFFSQPIGAVCRIVRQFFNEKACSRRFYRNFLIARVYSRIRIGAFAACGCDISNGTGQNVRFRNHIRCVKGLYSARCKACNRPAFPGQAVVYGNIRHCQVTVVCYGNFILGRFAKDIRAAVCRRAYRRLMNGDMPVLSVCFHFRFTRRYRNICYVRIRACAACHCHIDYFAGRNVRFGYHVGRTHYGTVRAWFEFRNLPLRPGQLVAYRNICKRQVAVVDCRDFIGNRFAQPIRTAVCRCAYRSLC